MTNINLFKNEAILYESSKVDDLLDFTKLKKAILSKMNQVSNTAIIAIVGRYGIGKSTAIYSIEKTSKDKIWINFNAWKYPDRSNLWEGFILDFADQIGIQKKILKKIDGKSTGGKNIDLLTDIIQSFKDIPGIGIVDKIFERVFEKSPAKRVFELQYILRKIIEGLDKDVVIVVEDIDRSGDAGIYFIETLKHFLGEIDYEKVIVIIPICDENYSVHKESYVKCIDYTYSFSPRNIDFKQFIEEVINLEIYDDKDIHVDRKQVDKSLVVEQLNSFFKVIFDRYPQMTIRSLKLVLRNSNILYKEMHEESLKADPRLVIVIEMMKYLQVDQTNTKSESIWEDSRRNNRISSSFPVTALLRAIAVNKPDLYSSDKTLYRAEVTFTDAFNSNTLLLVPWFFTDPFESNTGYYLNNSYLNF